MHSEKTTALLRKLVKINKAAQSWVIFWNTLLLPLLIAIFVTYLLNNKGIVDLIVWALAGIVATIHISTIILQIKGSTLDTMLIEYQEKSQKLDEISKEFLDLKSFYETDASYFSTQRTATRFAVESLSYAVGKIRNSELQGTRLSDEDTHAMIHSLIWPIVVYREKLFSFPSGSLWNMALYQLNADGNLTPKWREYDKRIKPRNRDWKPGFGVVGMSYLHKTIKYYEDIQKHSDSDHNSTSDMETYRSIIAVPIIPCEDSSSVSDHEPSGVLVITSSEPEQFNLDRDAVFLNIYANLMAILLEKVQTHAEHINQEEEK
ncbi:GAF domain-containing protein [Pseudomonas sp.]|uniref:GAF domain-containing protein n=1 Tax=Pseudomonas sp. TaxID=306 RepID=UPI00273483B4|nr:hypothetical protein [Pseudomonas sp.]MDP3816612.1 hypothetical protein [Pseudomonas sp.]